MAKMKIFIFCVVIYVLLLSVSSATQFEIDLKEPNHSVFEVNSEFSSISSETSQRQQTFGEDPLVGNHLKPHIMETPMKEENVWEYPR